MNVFCVKHSSQIFRWNHPLNHWTQKQSASILFHRHSKENYSRRLYTHSFGCRSGTGGKIIHSKRVQHYLLSLCSNESRLRINFFGTNRFTLCGTASDWQVQRARNKATQIYLRLSRLAGWQDFTEKLHFNSNWQCGRETASPLCHGRRINVDGIVQRHRDHESSSATASKHAFVFHFYLNHK